MGNVPLSAELFLARRLVNAVEGFVDAFATVGAPGALEDLFDGKRFDGGTIGQQPEAFTEKKLIQPCLEALRYPSRQSNGVTAGDVHHVHEPSEFPKVESNFPDFKLANVDPRIVCIVESKRVNRELPRKDRREASSDIETYLRANTFANHLQAKERRVLVGIATDGFRWNLWAKDVLSDTLEKDIECVTIEKQVVETATNRLYDGPAEEKWRVEVTKSLRQKLVRGFAPEYLAARATNAVDVS